jgi:DNA-binding transcriptional LysR family regulator
LQDLEHSGMDRIELVAAFVAVAEQGSFVGAARKLARSTASVSRAVAALESLYAIQLLNRTTRAVSLTDAGERYLQQARRFLAELDELESAFRGARSVANGRLTIAAPVVFGRLHVLPIVTSFLSEHPLVDAELMLLDRIVSYVDEGVDLGVRIGELPDSSLQARRVGSVRRVFCASPDYLARYGEPKSLADFGSHAIIVATGSSFQQTEWLSKIVPTRKRPKLSVNSVDAAIAACCAGAGIARFLSYQIATAESQGLLKRILPENASQPTPIHVVRPAGRQPSLATTLFIEKATKTLRKQFGD